MGHIKEADKVREVIVSKVFDATPQVVFEDWIYPNKLSLWWGSKDFTNTLCTIHARTGGAMLIHMRASDGSLRKVKGTFHEITQPERIVFTTYSLDAEDHPVLEVLHTVTFTADGDQTLVRVRAEVLKVKPDGVRYMAGMEQGWRDSLERLAVISTRI